MLAFVGIVGFYLAYMCWFTLLKQCRLDEAGPFLLLMPVVGIVTAALVLGESVSLAQLVGRRWSSCSGLAIVSGLQPAEAAGAGLSPCRAAGAPRSRGMISTKLHGLWV